MRPLLSVVFVPSMPMNDDRLSTAGSLQDHLGQAAAAAATMAVETKCVCGASDTPRITPVSCTGKKPLGTTMYR